MAILCGTRASTMISGVYIHALLLEEFYAFLWILILKSLEPIVMETQVVLWYSLLIGLHYSVRMEDLMLMCMHRAEYALKLCADASAEVCAYDSIIQFPLLLLLAEGEGNKCYNCSRFGEALHSEALLLACLR